MKIGVLGGGGFIGSQLVAHLSSEGLSCETISSGDYAKYIGKSFDVLINSNGNSSKVLAEKDPNRDYELSVVSVEKSLRDFSYKKYLYLSSVDVYGRLLTRETTGENEDISSSDCLLYGDHKKKAEQSILDTLAGHKDWLILRLGAVVGPGLKKGPIFDILSGSPVWIHPSSTLQYLSTKNLSELIHQLILRSISNEIFNISGGGNIRYGKLMELCTYSLPIEKNLPILNHNVNNEKIKVTLNDIKIDDTEQCLTEFIALDKSLRHKKPS